MKKSLKKLANKQIALLASVAAFVALVSFAVTFTITSNKATSQTRCAGVCVALREDKAEPDTLTVKKGSFVQFNSADGKTHSLSRGKGGKTHSHSGKFTSGEFKADEAWRVQFKEEGSFFFHDHFNPKINVLVVVYKPGKDYKVE